MVRTKKIEEKHDGDLCLLQITLGTHATIYNMQKDSFYEVSLIKDIDQFKNPIVFSNTGFVYQTEKGVLKNNLSNTLGIRSPIPKNKARGIYRAFSEMDLQ